MSANLGFDYLVDSQAQKTATVNDALETLDGVLSNQKDVSMTDANYTMDDSTEAQKYAAFKFSGTLTANRNVTVPARKRMYLICNATSGGHTLTVKTASGTGIAVSVASTTYRLLFCDGTNVVALAVS